MASASCRKRQSQARSIRSSYASSRQAISPTPSRKRGHVGDSSRESCGRRTTQKMRAIVSPSSSSMITASSVGMSDAFTGNNPRDTGRGSASCQGSGVSTQPLRAEQSNESQTGEEVGDAVLESQIIMAVDVQSKDTVGCCYYNSDEQTLYLFEDITSGGDDMIERLTLDIMPTHVLASTRADQSTSRLSPNAQATSGTAADRQFGLPYVLEPRPCQDFNATYAISQLATLQSSLAAETTRILVPSDACTAGNAAENDEIGLTDQRGKLIALSGFLNTDNHVSIGCAGALLTYLQKKRFSSRITANGGEPDGYDIQNIELMSLNDTLFLNQDTLASLQIIQSESHPNVSNQGPNQAFSGSKESFSLFGLFYHFARTPQGKARLRQIFLRPSTDLDLLRQRHDFISTFLRPENAIHLEKINKSMKGVKNLKPVLVQLRKGVAHGNKFTGFKSGLWATLMEFAYHTIDIQETLNLITGGEHLDLLNKILERLDAQKLHYTGRIIHQTVDLTASAEEGRTVVNPNVDTELDELKHFYSGLESLLSQVAIDIATTLPEDAKSSINVIYFPQLGFNIAIALRGGRPVYDGTEEGWEKVFVTENRAYFKDDRMREMDAKLGDVYGHICEREIEITYELAQQVLENEVNLSDASEACGELDSVLALVHGANLYKLSRPKMVEDNIIDIKGGRHLLYESTVPSFVPNDTFLVGGNGQSSTAPSSPSSERMSSSYHAEGPSMLLLTGPNYSGKSAYLKQVASIVFLAHVGSFVPADAASIGLTDKILTRVTTRETVTKAKSSFMLDLEQISIALHTATHRSLIIIDEFGKGTDSSDGAGLACGLFEYLLGLGNERPKILGATHFHEIFETGFLVQRPHLAFGHMETQINPESHVLEDQITYLYNLCPGRSKVSFGMNCAAMNGIDGEILRRAQDLTDLAANGEDLGAACAKVSREEIIQLKEAEKIARSFLSTDLRQSHDALGITDISGALREMLSRAMAMATTCTLGSTSVSKNTSVDETSTTQSALNEVLSQDSAEAATCLMMASSTEGMSDIS